MQLVVSRLTTTTPGYQKTTSLVVSLAEMQRNDVGKQLLPVDATVATEQKLQNGDAVPMAPELFAMPVVCTTPN